MSKQSRAWNGAPVFGCLKGLYLSPSHPIPAQHSTSALATVRSASRSVPRVTHEVLGPLAWVRGPGGTHSPQSPCGNPTVGGAVDFLACASNSLAESGLACTAIRPSPCILRGHLLGHVIKGGGGWLDLDLEIAFVDPVHVVVMHLRPRSQVREA